MGKVHGEVMGNGPDEAQNSSTSHLVVTGTCVFSHSVGNVIIPTVTHSIIFQRGRLKPPTGHDRPVSRIEDWR